MANFYYYTSAKHAISNIENERIKISQFLKLNDPYELLCAERVDRNIRKQLIDAKKQINDKKGLICLSKNWRSLLMCAHYADRHKGIVLGFEVKKGLEEEVKYETKLIDPPKNSSPDCINNFIDKLKVNKFTDWKYENEVRVFQKLSGTECIKEGEIILGTLTKTLSLKKSFLVKNVRSPRCKSAHFLN